MNSSALYLAIVVVWLVVLVPMLLRRDAADPEPTSEERFHGDADTDADPDADAGLNPDAGFPRDRGRAGADDPDSQATQVLAYDEYLPGLRTRAAGVADGGAAPDGRDAGPEGDLDDLDDDPDDLDEEQHLEQAPLPALPTSAVPRGRVIARRRRRTAGLTALVAGTAVAVGLGAGPWWVLMPPVLLLGGHLVLLREAAKADAERGERRRRVAARRSRRPARVPEPAPAPAEVIDLPSPREHEVYDQYTDAHLRAAGD